MAAIAIKSHLSEQNRLIDTDDTDGDNNNNNKNKMEMTAP